MRLNSPLPKLEGRANDTKRIRNLNLSICGKIFRETIIKFANAEEEKSNDYQEICLGVLMYPEGDKSVSPSGRMPKNGWYFDSIIRQEPIDDDNLNPEDTLEEFKPIADEDLAYYKQETERLDQETDKAIFADFGFTGFGDIALVPAPWLKNPPKGIRDVEEWYMSTVIRQDYVYEVFDRQCEIALNNLAKIYNAVGDRVTVILVSATDFGMQQGLLVSPNSYRELYKPFHIRVNDWIHTNTTWKTFIHSPAVQLFH